MIPREDRLMFNRQRLNRKPEQNEHVIASGYNGRDGIVAGSPIPRADQVQPHAVRPAVRAAWGPRWRPTTETAGTAVSRTGSASCSAWRPPGRRRWRSTAWPTGTTMRMNPRTASRHLPAGLLERPLGRGLHVWSARWLSSPRRSCSCPTAGRCTCRSPCCFGSWAIRTASGSPAWLISGWASR